MESVTLPDGTVITKGDNGEFTITQWGSVEVVDKENQILPMDELIKDAPTMMAHSPKVHLGHTDTEIGVIKDIRFADKMTKDQGLQKGVQVTWDAYGDRRFHKAVRKKIEAGKLPEMSIKGFAYERSFVDKGGKVVEVLKDIEAITFALCERGMNPEATTIDVNGKAIAKSDELALMGNETFKQHLTTYLKDGLSYRQAMDAVKMLFSNELHKEMANDLEPLVILKESKEWNTVTEEELRKDLTVLKEAVEAQKDKIDALVKEKESMANELKELKEKKEIKKEDLVADVEKSLLANKDSLIEKLGFKKSETPSAGFPTHTDMLKSFEKDDKALIELADAVRKGAEMKKNANLEAIPSYETMEKSLRGEK